MFEEQLRPGVPQTQLRQSVLHLHTQLRQEQDCYEAATLLRLGS